MAACKICKLEQAKALELRGSQYVYLNPETGKKWHGKVCPHCVANYAKDKRGTEEVLKVCEECNAEFLTSKSKQVVCSYPCRLKRVSRQVTEKRRQARHSR